MASGITASASPKSPAPMPTSRLNTPLIKSRICGPYLASAPSRLVTPSKWVSVREMAPLSTAMAPPDWEGMLHNAGPNGPMRGCLIEIDIETGDTRVLAGGLRTPNGLGWTADGAMIYLDNQGTWMPTNQLVELLPQRFYGHYNWTNFVPKLAERKVSLGIASLRAYGLNEDMLDEIQRVGIDGLTFAPEAGTQRMRDVINKNVSDEDILTSARRIFSRITSYLILPGTPASDIVSNAAIKSCESCTRVFR